MHAILTEWFGYVDGQIVRYCLVYGSVQADPENVWYGIRVGYEILHHPESVQWLAGKDYHQSTVALRHLAKIKASLEDAGGDSPPLHWNSLSPLSADAYWLPLIRKELTSLWDSSSLVSGPPH